MKKITILVAALLMMAISAQAQGIQKVIDKYSTDERFTYVSVGSGLIEFGLSFLGDKKVEGIDKESLSKLKGVRVLSYQWSPTDAKITKSVMNELTKALRADPKTETLLEIRDFGDVTSIHFTSEGLLIINKFEWDDITVVFILGDISKKLMQDLVSKFKK